MCMSQAKYSLVAEQGKQTHLIYSIALSLSLSFFCQLQLFHPIPLLCVFRHSTVKLIVVDCQVSLDVLECVQWQKMYPFLLFPLVLHSRILKWLSLIFPPFIMEGTKRHLRYLCISQKDSLMITEKPCLWLLFVALQL